MHRSKTWRVLLADDSDAVRTLLRVLLALEPDLEVVGEAATGTDALDLVASARPDVLVLDLSMPGLDGLEVLERLRAAGAGVRVAVYSGHATGGIERAARDLGADDFIVKGTAPEDVVARIRRVAG
jgi:DNA-binding NarL/FixJ family response regulator